MDQNPHAIDPDDSRDTVRIPLSQGFWATVDRADLPLLQGRIWSAKVSGRTVYAFTNTRNAQGKRTTIFMHSLITGVAPGTRVDHKNRDGTDNRRQNLRIATAHQNAINSLPRKGGSSRFKGVFLHRKTGKWAASIRFFGQRVHLGLWESERDAAAIYDWAASVCYPDFACTNGSLGLIPTISPFVPGLDLKVPA